MTAYVVFQMIEDGRISLEDEVAISKKAWKTGGSKSFIEVGKSIKLETLLKGMIIQSGNDAAVALAEHVAGTEDTFAAYMNEYAQQLGMLETSFKNASGLPAENQHTTAHDIALLSIATIRDFPQFYPWYAEKEFTYNDIKQRNRNRLLWTDPSIDGLKTGFTEKAGYNLATSANRAGMRLISVVLGSTSVKQRRAQTQTILNYGFRFFESVKIDNINKQVPILKAAKDKLKVGLANTTHLTLPRGQFKLAKQTIKLNKQLSAPIQKGDAVGDLIISFKQQTLATLPLVALENIEESGFFQSILSNIKSLF